MRGGHYGNECLMISYRGQIYLDIAYDLDNPLYRRVQDFLEHEDGSMLFADTKFWLLSLKKAIENAHRDEPGFWERWGEIF
jgi:hypothetical protein